MLVTWPAWCVLSHCTVQIKLIIKLEFSQPKLQEFAAGVPTVPLRPLKGPLRPIPGPKVKSILTSISKRSTSALKAQAQCDIPTGRLSQSRLLS